MDEERDTSQGTLELTNRKTLIHKNKNGEVVDEYGPYMTRLGAIMEGARIAINNKLKFEPRN